MKIIDGKGKLFGKVSVIDLLIVLVVLAVATYGGYRLSKGGMGVADKKVKATVVFLGTEVTDAVASTDIYSYALVTGASQFNGKIIDKEVTPCVVYDKETGDAIEKGYNNVLITAEVTLSDRGNMYKLGSTELRVGGEYELKTKDFYLETEVQSITIMEE